MQRHCRYHLQLLLLGRHHHQVSRWLHASPAVAKNAGKPRLRTIPVGQRPGASGTRGGAAFLALTPDALKQKIQERNAAEAADPRRGRQPPTDAESSCYLRDLFETRRYPLAEILRRHREFASPEMLNNASGPLFATCLFDMTAAKSGKFVAPFAKVVSLPHALPQSVAKPHSVIAFCSSPELAVSLKEAGAFDAGGSDLITKLETGVYIAENFDYVVCHPDFWPTLLKARKLLKDAMPLPKSAQVSEDLEAALNLYRFGVPARLSQSGDLPDRAQCRLPFGLLDWPDYHLESNLGAIVAALMAERPRRSVGSFLVSLAVTCPPSDELFLADLRPFLASAVDAPVDAELPKEDEAAPATAASA